MSWLRKGAGRLLVACVLAPGVGCKSHEATDSSPATKGSPIVAVAARATSDPVTRPERKPNPTREEVARLIDAVENDPDLACERAYTQTKAAITNAPPTIDGKPAHDLDFSKETFLEDCHAMPTPVQRCLVFEYAFTNNAYCKAERAKYDASRVASAPSTGAAD